MTWKQLIEKYPEVRTQLYKSRRLFFLTAYGAFEPVGKDSEGNIIRGISIEANLKAIDSGRAARNRNELRNLKPEEMKFLDDMFRLSQEA